MKPLQQLLTLLCSIILIGCDSVPGGIHANQQSGQITGNPDLVGCKYYYIMVDGSSPDMQLIKCPNSTTTTQYTTQSGKISTPHNITVIDNDNQTEVIEQRLDIIDRRLDNSTKG